MSPRCALRAIALTALLCVPLFSAGCVGCLGPSEPRGDCSGSIGTTDVTGAIDPEATYFKLLRKETCAQSDRHQFDMSYAGGELHILALTDAWSVLQSRSTHHDLRPVETETHPMVHEWRIHAPTDRPALTAGWVGATRGPGGEVQGDFEMEFEDGSAVNCSFEIPFEKKRAEGKYPDCGGSGDGVDFDD